MDGRTSKKLCRQFQEAMRQSRDGHTTKERLRSFRMTTPMCTPFLDELVSELERTRESMRVNPDKAPPVPSLQPATSFVCEGLQLIEVRVVSDIFRR